LPDNISVHRKACWRWRFFSRISAGFRGSYCHCQLHSEDGPLSFTRFNSAIYSNPVFHNPAFYNFAISHTIHHQTVHHQTINQTHKPVPCHPKICNPALSALAALSDHPLFLVLSHVLLTLQPGEYPYGRA
jgi:hypothetical protein